MAIPPTDILQPTSDVSDPVYYGAILLVLVIVILVGKPVKK